MEKSDTSFMKVTVAPCWMDNPYLQLLFNSLRKFKVETVCAEHGRHFHLIRSVFEQKSDILHIHWHYGYFSPANYFTVFIKITNFILEVIILKFLGKKIVWTIHELVNPDRVFPRLELFSGNFLFWLSDAVIVHSKTAKYEIFKKFFFSNPNKIVIIPHGNYLSCYENKISKEEARKALKLSSSDLVFLYFGKIRPYKGVTDLIDSFKQLNDRSIKLIIAGSPFSKNIKKSIKDKAKGDSRIKSFLKFIPEDNVQTYFNAVDIVVLPYKEIFTSGGVFLAMSFGKAVIAPKLGCIPDILDESGSFLYDSREENGLLESMKKAVNLRIELPKMGDYNLQIAKELDWDKTAEATQKLYDQVLGQ